MAYVVQLKVYRPSAYSDLASAINHDHVVVYFNEFHDMIVFEGQVPQDLVATIESQFNTDLEFSYSPSRDTPINYVLLNTLRDENSGRTRELILKNHGIQLSPVMFIGDWEYHKFLCMTDKIVAKIIKALQNTHQLEILSVEKQAYYNPLEFFGITAGKLHDSLSDKQLDLLVEAYREGYYKIPRDVKLADIAKNHKKSRYAIQRSIRKAENKLMEMIVPLIDLEDNLQKLLQNRT